MKQQQVLGVAVGRRRGGHSKGLREKMKEDKAESLGGPLFGEGIFAF